MINFPYDFRSKEEIALDSQREAHEDDMNESEISQMEENVYRDFARVYPHECFDDDPERFWKFYHAKNPDISRADMERALKDTRE